MRRFYIILIISCGLVTGPEVANAYDTSLDPVRSYLHSQQLPEWDSTELEKYDQLIERFQSKERSMYSLERIFYKVHRKFLKHYVAFSDIPELVKKGEYDCASATVLFAYFLSELGYEYEVRFTPYHVFLLVRTAQGRVMIESTDPVSGFITKANEISERQSHYLEVANRRSFSKIHNLKETIGLLYYNRAVESYNVGQYEQALQLAVDAGRTLNNRVIDELLRKTTVQIVEKEKESETGSTIDFDAYFQLLNDRRLLQASN